MDDHETRQCGCSIVYNFPNQPSNEYNSAVLKNPSIYKFCYQSDYNRRSTAPDYLMDQKLDPINGQEFYCTTKKTKPVIFPKPKPSGAIRRRKKTVEKILEERLTIDKTAYLSDYPPSNDIQDNEQADLP